MTSEVPRSRPVAVLRAATAAVTFLTVLPVGRRLELDGRDVANGSVLFPVVGAGLGALSGCVAWLLRDASGRPLPLLAAAIAVAVPAVLTGMLHLDGLADYADGFGGRTMADRLRIMRDHSIGTYGAVALMLNLLIRVAALSSVAGTSSVVGIAAAAGALSRVAGPVLSSALPYARPGAGSGRALATSANWVRTAVTVVVALGVVLLCLWSMWWPAAFAAPFTACIALVLVGQSARCRLGGVTGDVMGAASELVETACLAVLAIVR